jgi:small subunit ribosomal protein S6
MPEKKDVLTVTAPRVRDYDLVFILSPELADDALEAAVTNVTTFITNHGGTITKVDRWGKKKLAYPLKKFLEGNYVLVNFKMETTRSKEVEAQLLITETILRHLLINPES